MRKFLAAAIAAAIALSFTACVKSSAPKNISAKFECEYFSFDVPNGWIKKNEYMEEKDYLVCLFVSKDTGVNFGISQLEYTSSKTLSDFGESWAEASTVSGRTVLEKGSSEFDGVPSYEILWSSIEDDRVLMCRETLAVVDGKLFNIRLLGNGLLFADMEKEAQPVLDSFEFASQ